MEIQYKLIGKQIRKARMRNGLTIEDLAGRVQITSSYISHIENGRRNMSLETFVDITRALNVSADELLSDILGSKIRSTSHEMMILLRTAVSSKGGVCLAV